jgi:hypothetical protein
MSILRDIFARLSGRAHAAQPKETPAATAAPVEAPAPAEASAPAAAPAAAPALPALTEVDLVVVMEGKAAVAGQKLNWRTSIVDLMKLLDLDSSLATRKALAAELGYTGSTDDSAAMNVWLHKQVMRKVAENGGQVPADLRD